MSTMQRRDFLKTLGGASVAAGWMGGSLAAQAGTVLVEPAAFGFADDRVPMNAANLCPMPAVVRDAVAAHARELDRDMSHIVRGRIEQLKEKARSGLARQLGVSADEIAIVRNTSEANNIVVQGMPLTSDDEVLLWDQNHPSNGVAWDVQAKRAGCRVRRLAVPASVASADELVDLFVAALRPQTRVVSFTHISNVSGTRLPAGEICRALRRKNEQLYIHVDGAQTWGIIDVDLARLGCDSFSASAHKWFMGPREVGLLYVRQPQIERLWPNSVSVPWGEDVDPAVAGARKFEAFGQRNDAAIAALHDAVMFHDSLTPAGIERRAESLAQRLRDGLQDLGVSFISPLEAPLASNVVILAAQRETGSVLVERVLQESGIIVAAVGGLRLTPHIYNTEEHIDRAIAAIAKLRGLLAS
ncbi:MAG: aminotransferase class V-fold PLP-dependent enzyme [Woeseia sp.]